MDAFIHKSLTSKIHFFLRNILQKKPGILIKRGGEVVTTISNLFLFAIIQIKEWKGNIV